MDRHDKRGAVLDFSECQDHTHQEFKDECDVNRIMARALQFREDPALAPGEAKYGDFSEFPEDLLGMHEQVRSAQEAFDALPARVRERFGNSPYNLVEFVADEKNKAEAMELGLIDKPAPPPVPVSVTVVTPAPATPPVATPPAAG